MENKKNSRLVDALLLLLIILPLVLAMAIKICTTPDAPLEDGVVISGAQVYFTIPMPLQEWPITAAQVNSWAIILSILGVCLYLTHGIKVIPDSKRQLAAEWIVDTVNKLVSGNMGEKFMGFAPFVAGILALSALSSLSSLLGLFAPTSDLNIVLGWAILVFILITHYKLQGGLWNYIKGFFSPIPFFAPLNIIGEFATPISMAFRHYGNVMSGMVISVLIAFALRNLSVMVLGWLPGFLGQIPFLQVGLPAVLSLYFDIFSGCMQAFIFAMLTMMNIATAVPEEE